MGQTDRILWLDAFLFRCQKSPQTRPAVVAAFNKSCADSADHISYNTMVRDMEMLSECGAEVVYRNNGWYSTKLAFRCNMNKKATK